MTTQHIGRIGLNNNGNTCYLNAAIQLLSHSSYFVHKLFIEANNGNTDKFNDVEKNILELFLEKWILKNKVYNPINIQKSIAKINPMFNPGRQNDSSEAMVLLLDLITYKPLQPIFQNKFNSIRQCMNCKNTFERIEIFNILSLDMSSSIKDSLDNFCKTEDMDGQVNCEVCQTKQDFQRTYKIDKLANNLIIHMKRFECINNRKYIKNNKPIDIQDIIHITDNKYELRGINIHSGRRNGGHYYFIGKNLNNEWTEYNDRNCHPININLKQFAVIGYIFLYEKIK